MIYVVHTIPDQKRVKFASFRPAFKAFVQAAKASDKPASSVALWYGTALATWQRLHATERYPERLTQPFER
jgi:hypothetical protein